MPGGHRSVSPLGDVSELLAELRGWLFAHARVDPPPEWIREYAETHPDVLVRAECHSVLASVTARDGPYEAAHRHLDEAEKLYLQIDDVDAEAVPARWNVLHTRGFVTFEGADTIEKAQCRFQAALDFAREHNFDYGAQLSLLNLGWISLKSGEPTTATLQLVEVITAPNPAQRPYVHARRALTSMLAASGDLTEALNQITAAVEATGASLPRDRIQCLIDLGELRALTGDIAGAEAALAEAVGLAGEEPDFVLESGIGHLEARLQLAKGRLAEADASARALEDDDPSQHTFVAAPLHMRMEAALAAGDTAGALELAQSIDRLMPHQMPRYWELLASAHSGQRDWEQALKYLRHAEQARREYEFEPHVLLRMRNVSHTSLSEEAIELRNQHETIAELVNHNDQLLDLVTHELNGPLGTIRMALDVVEIDPAQSRHHARSIHHTLRRMWRTVGSLRATWDLRTGELAATPESVDVAAVVGDLIDEFSSSALRKEIGLERCGVESAIARATTGHVEICIANLVSNALKFSTGGTHVQVTIDGDPDRVRVTVQDQGPGLTDSDVQRAFSRGGRLSARPTGGESSDGFGLFISRELARSMGGDLIIEPCDKGARFVLELKRD